MDSFKKTALVLIVVSLVLLLGSTLFMGQELAVADDLTIREGTPLPSPPQDDYVPDQIIVKFKEGVLGSAEASLNSSLGTEVIYTSPFAGFKVLQIPEGKTVDEMVQAYSGQAIIEYAEPNYIDHVIWSPNDPGYYLQWHFDQDHGINLEDAWDLDTTSPLYGGDPGIIVAVVDSGVAYETYGGYLQAPDLANTNFTTGYDFVNSDAHPNDDAGHGTHVCGTIAQSTNNGTGVAGIAFNTTIMPVKTLDSSGGGTHAQMADGFYYAADNGAHIINYSAGGSHSITKQNAVIYAYNAGVTIICAAGNDYESGNPPNYPAAYDDYCIAVGATRWDRTRSYYSNTGSYLDIVAPGGDTNVDQNGDSYVDGVLQQTFAEGDPTDFGYYFFQGTSMACPHVSGVAALILARQPSWTSEQVRQALQTTAIDLGTAGWDEMYGWGLLNAPAAVAAAGGGAGATDKIGTFYTGNYKWYLDLNDNGVPDDSPTGVFGSSKSKPVAGDWDGDGDDDIGTFYTGNYCWYLKDLDDGSVNMVGPFGSNKSIPVVGDWDGDGDDDIGTFYTGNYCWYLKDLDDGSVSVVGPFGSNKSIPVAGDWDGDGDDDIGTFYTGNYRWYLKDLDDGSVSVTGVFGSNKSKPVAGDWDGDGDDDIGTFYTGNYKWYLRDLDDGSVSVTSVFGSGKSIPVAGNWDGS
jgi:serine protease